MEDFKFKHASKYPHLNDGEKEEGALFKSKVANRDLFNIYERCFFKNRHHDILPQTTIAKSTRYQRFTDLHK